MKRVLITGAEGFTGRFLAQAFKTQGYEVHGLCRQPKPDGIYGVDVVHVADLADKAALQLAVNQAKADKVAHLAAIAFVPHGNADAVYQTNVQGSRNLLEVLSFCPHQPEAVLLASSAHVYGNAVEGTLDESTPLAPTSDYAVSKLSMEFVAKLYQTRLPMILVRPFNYTGVGQHENYLIPKIVNHARRRAPVIELGNLDVARDFSDVRMVVNCYRQLLENPAAISQTFNVCSGQSWTLQQVLDMVCDISGHNFEIKVNPAFVRLNDVKILQGDRSLLDSVIGTSQRIAFHDTLRWMLEH
ncbi:GDP-mannose 4,6-dehydratase [Chromobacterium violaceum]|uniref:GDP-mannose 4,6-dehydratase n=1 Tax=Chromobacterium violaceum TaxID=536 RepID=UPI001B31A4A1|nr:GDP-mannose 4,6-dehydratase [Chromobacterium violaceum]MBP4044687.1 GDP-mannose 4,6-dehydratase [Chromobacterium violaceum]